MAKPCAQVCPACPQQPFCTLLTNLGWAWTHWIFSRLTVSASRRDLVPESLGTCSKLVTHISHPPIPPYRFYCRNTATLSENDFSVFRYFQSLSVARTWTTDETVHRAHLVQFHLLRLSVSFAILLSDNHVVSCFVLCGLCRWVLWER